MKKSVKFGNEIVSKNIKARLERSHLEETLRNFLSQMMDIDASQDSFTTVRLAELQECLTEAKKTLGITNDEIDVMLQEADTMSHQNLQVDDFDGGMIHTNVNMQQFIEMFSH